jgi:hypothetical protein
LIELLGQLLGLFDLGKQFSCKLCLLPPWFGHHESQGKFIRDPTLPAALKFLANLTFIIIEEPCSSFLPGLQAQQRLLHVHLMPVLNKPHCIPGLTSLITQKVQLR